MKLNWSDRIIGERVVLVPYRRCHVPKYHSWMQDPHILECTASEPLSLDDEYEMQRSWRDDPEKLTFLIVDATDCADEAERLRLNSSCVSRLVGDVNNFLNCDGCEDKAEIEVMVAVESARRKGIAEEALSLLIKYSEQKLGISCFVAKIGEKNLPSLNLFEKKLGFVRTKYSEPFEEYVLEFNCQSRKGNECQEDKLVRVLEDIDPDSC